MVALREIYEDTSLTTKSVACLRLASRVIANIARLGCLFKDLLGKVGMSSQGSLRACSARVQLPS